VIPVLPVTDPVVPARPAVSAAVSTVGTLPAASTPIVPTAAVATVATAPVMTALNTAVVKFLDDTATFFNGLPAPISEFLEGALLLVRRTLFNQAPTAEPLQYAQDSVSVLGTIGAADAEGDPIVYEVIKAPIHGAVEIGEDGDWTYTPPGFDSRGGTDSFTVKLTNAGSPLNLVGANYTKVVVPVTIAPVIADGSPGSGTYTSTFTVYNRSSKSLFYRQQESGDLESGPKVGTEVKPGGQVTFEVYRYFWSTNTVRVAFGSENNADWYAVDLFNTDAYRTGLARNCYASGTNKCSTPGGTSVDFLDAPNTTIVVPASEMQKQADWLNGLCFSGSAAQCNFTINKEKTGYPKPKYNNFTSQQLADSYTNSTTLPQTWTFSKSLAQNTETSWSIAANVKATLIDKVLEASITGTYGEKWSTTRTETYTYPTTVPPGETSYLYIRQPIKTLIGDFSVTMGNTTWNLKDVEFYYPDSTRRANVEATFKPKPDVT